MGKTSAEKLTAAASVAGGGGVSVGAGTLAVIVGAGVSVGGGDEAVAEGSADGVTPGRGDGSCVDVTASVFVGVAGSGVDVAAAVGGTSVDAGNGVRVDVATATPGASASFELSVMLR
jgi:hypothetical protein